MADRPYLPIRATLRRCAAVKDRSAFDALSGCPRDTMQALEIVLGHGLSGFDFQKKHILAVFHDQIRFQSGTVPVKRESRPLAVMETLFEQVRDDHVLEEIAT